MFVNFALQMKIQEQNQEKNYTKIHTPIKIAKIKTVYVNLP